MSKLDNTILKYGNAVLDLPKTNDPIGKPVDEAKADIKALMLELIDSCTRHDYINVDELHKKVEEL